MDTESVVATSVCVWLSCSLLSRLLVEWQSGVCCQLAATVHSKSGDRGLFGHV